MSKAPNSSHLEKEGVALCSSVRRRRKFCPKLGSGESVGVLTGG